MLKSSSWMQQLKSGFSFGGKASFNLLKATQGRMKHKKLDVKPVVPFNCTACRFSVCKKLYTTFARLHYVSPDHETRV